MKNILSLCPIFILLIFSRAVLSDDLLAFSPSNEDELLATVFEKSITTKEIASTTFNIASGHPNSVSDNMDDEYRYKVLSNLIYTEIYQRLDQECHINVTDEEVQSYITTMNKLREKMAPLPQTFLDIQEQHFQLMTEAERLKFEQRQQASKVQKALS